MKTAGLVLATNTETDRAFDAGVRGVLLGLLGVLALLYYVSVLTFSGFVAWVLVGIPALGSFRRSYSRGGWGTRTKPGTGPSGTRCG